MIESSALNHLLRTMAAVPTKARVLVRGGAEGRAAHPLAQLGFEVHAAPWTDAAARRVHRASETTQGGATVYATAAPVRALPYPEAHFAWVVVLVPPLQDGPDDDSQAMLQSLLEEARHHLRPGGWVFVTASDAAPDAERSAEAAPVPDLLDEAAESAGLAEAEAPERAETQVHAIYRRVEPATPP